MDSPETNPAAALLGLLMILQLALTLALLLGGIFVLYCLNRAASGLDRLASVAEAWLSAQNPAQNHAGPPVLPSVPVPNEAPHEWAPTVQAPEQS